MKVFPVVHINTPETAVEQASVALELGADGVYLIDHYAMDDKQLFQVFNEVDAKNKGAFIGLNMLDHTPRNAFMVIEAAYRGGALNRLPDALWNDDAFAEYQRGETDAYRAQHPELQGVRYLGGVAFKYTDTFTEDPALAGRLAQLAHDNVDIVTTSGEATGKAPSVQKIIAMKQSAGTLAVASGISLENLSNYAGLVDEVLVASSVETARYSGIFDVQKLGQFIETAHSFSDIAA